LAPGINPNQKPHPDDPVHANKIFAFTSVKMPKPHPDDPVHANKIFAFTSVKMPLFYGRFRRAGDDRL